MMSMRVAGLIRACHPEPTLAVTLLSTALLIGAGNRPLTCCLGAFALLTGQLSIGWSNDLIDGIRDIAAARTDKPLAVGSLDRTVLRRATIAAVTLTVPASLALGWLPGLIHLVAVGAGWAYNLGLKSGWLSPLPYLVAFASLPVIATRALAHPHWPPGWIVAAAGLIGVAAHFANVLPDLSEDLAAGVRGVPQRLGGSRAAATATSLTVTATLVLLVARPGWPSFSVLIAVVGLTSVAIRSTRATTALYAIMLCAALNVVLIVSSNALRA